jgi:hypothetical protein
MRIEFQNAIHEINFHANNLHAWRAAVAQTTVASKGNEHTFIVEYESYIVFIILKLM